MHDSLLALLRCPVCRNLLNAPTTLHCGHTVCTIHLQSPVCPVPRCLPHHPAAPPNIPPSSTVAYYPANPSNPPNLPSLATPTSRIDVTVSKILDLLDRLHRQLHPLRPDRRRSRSPESIDRPRKRRRHRPPQDNDDSDLLSHLVATSARQRTTLHDQPLLPSDPPASNSDSILASFEKDLLAELTCEICFTLFYDPITTPCQHTFCTKCLHRALDHGATCPLCRQDLPGFIYFQEHPPNKVILSLLLEAFPAPYRERGEAIEAEERDARLDTPIFVCQLSFPGMPTLLHFFEPRYRLMLRRCLESPNPCFGMVMPSKPGSASPHLDYGTMLEIRSVQMQADGRSLVETWGTYRFRILETGTLDGYMVGRIERIDDYPEDITENPPPAPLASPASPSTPASSDPVPAVQDTDAPAPSTLSPSTSSPTATPPPTPSRDPSPTPPPLPLLSHPSNSALMAQCRSFLDQLERGTAPWIVQRLSSTYGTMPTDISSFSYWVASILPIDDHEKAKLLPIRSPRLRLILVVHWIEQLNNNWYTVFHFARAVTTGLLLIGFLCFFWPILPLRLAGLLRWFSSGCGIV